MVPICIHIILIFLSISVHVKSEFCSPEQRVTKESSLNRCKSVQLAFEVRQKYILCFDVCTLSHPHTHATAPESFEQNTCSIYTVFHLSPSPQLHFSPFRPFYLTLIVVKSLPSFFPPVSSFFPSSFVLHISLDFLPLGPPSSTRTQVVCVCVCVCV